MRRSSQKEAARADSELLTRRLRALGLRSPVEIHENRSVLVSVATGGVLRVHRGYAYASDRVLRAILTFVAPRTPRKRAGEARRHVLDFPVHDYVPESRGRSRTRRPARIRPEDRKWVARLADLFRQFNTLHFGGSLPEVPIRLSRRMSTRLGEITISNGGEPDHIAVSWRHVMRDNWDEVGHTVLHEMVHLWQAATGRTVDHGRGFRRKAKEVGIVPAASRTLDGGRTVTTDLFEEES